MKGKHAKRNLFPKEIKLKGQFILLVTSFFDKIFLREKGY